LLEVFLYRHRGRERGRERERESFTYLSTIAMAPKTLHGINRRPAARQALENLRRQQREPAATGINLLAVPANRIDDHWPVVGFPNYSFVKMDQPLAKLGFFGISYQIRKRNSQKRKGRSAWSKRPLRLDKELMLSSHWVFLLSGHLVV
jgi:hypothetical protein